MVNTQVESLPEELVEMDVLNALRKGPLTFDQIQTRTRILPGPLALTLAKLFRDKLVKVQLDDAGGVIYVINRKT